MTCRFVTPTEDTSIEGLSKRLNKLNRGNNPELLKRKSQLTSSTEVPSLFQIKKLKPSDDAIDLANTVSESIVAANATASESVKTYQVSGSGNSQWWQPLVSAVESQMHTDQTELCVFDFQQELALAEERQHAGAQALAEAQATAHADKLAEAQALVRAHTQAFAKAGARIAECSKARAEAKRRVEQAKAAAAQMNKEKKCTKLRAILLTEAKEAASSSRRMNPTAKANPEKISPAGFVSRRINPQAMANARLLAGALHEKPNARQLIGTSAWNFKLVTKEQGDQLQVQHAQVQQQSTSSSNSGGSKDSHAMWAGIMKESEQPELPIEKPASQMPACALLAAAMAGALHEKPSSTATNLAIISANNASAAAANDKLAAYSLLECASRPAALNVPLHLTKERIEELQRNIKETDMQDGRKPMSSSSGRCLPYLKVEWMLNSTEDHLST
jgi:hypothetical protein